MKRDIGDWLAIGVIVSVVLAVVLLTIDLAYSRPTEFDAVVVGDWYTSEWVEHVNEVPIYHRAKWGVTVDVDGRERRIETTQEMQTWYRVGDRVLVSFNVGASGAHYGGRIVQRAEAER